MPYAPTNLQRLHHIISAFRALPVSLPRSWRSVLVLAPFILCTCTLTISVSNTSNAHTTARSARPDSSCLHTNYPSDEHGLNDPCLRTLTVSVNNARAALEAVSIHVLRYISPFVRRRAAVRVVRAASDGDAPRISSQALTAIILCSAIGFCVLLGCILQLPAAFVSLRNRYIRSRRTRASTRGGSSNNIFDVEMGDQDAEAEGSLNLSLPSPPPPYSRAPSYESCRDTDNNTSTSGRGECQSTS